MDFFNFIQSFMDIFTGHMCFFFREMIYKLFHAVKLGGIHSRIGNTQRLGNTIVSIETVKYNGHQSYVYRTGYTKLFGKPVHGSPYTPCTGSTGEHD